MGQIIVIRKDDKLRELIKDNIEDYLDHQTIVKDTIEQVVSTLNVIQKIDLIILYQENADDHRQLNQLIRERDINTKVIYVTTDDHIEDEGEFIGFEFIPAKDHWLTVIKLAADILKINIYDMAKNMVEKFSAIATVDLYLFDKSPFDIYERSIAGQEREFKKILSIGEKIESSFVRELIKNNSKYIYIDEDNLIPFISMMIERFENKQKLGLLSENHVILSSIELHQQTLSILQGLGYTSSSTAFNLVEATINSIIEMWIKKRRLSKLLNVLIRSNGSLLFQHFTMTAIIASEMYEMMSDVKNDENTKILVYASFLHDISIYYNFNLIKIYSNELYDTSELSKHDKKRVWSHANDSAQIAAELDIPSGVETIIRQHHGSDDGNGFTDDIPENFSPLTHILIIAERFSFHILETHYYSNETLNVTKIIKRIFDEFPKTEEKYINLLKEVFIIENQLQKYDEIKSN